VPVSDAQDINKEAMVD